MSNHIFERFREYIQTNQFNALRIGLASPEKIKSLSYGEIKKIETINYRTLKPERDGLFCARIFGPVKDWECNCGKYKRMKHRGITCEKCGVEVIQARVRRERMGHINLVAPVCHIWYLKGVPSYLSLILDLPIKDLERVVYFDSYMVVNSGKSPYPIKTLLTSNEYERYLELHPEDADFSAEIGAEALKQVLGKMDLTLEIDRIKILYEKTTSVAIRHKIMRRIKILSGLVQANQRPDWMIISILPVLPPDLRPLVPLEGGRFASSDLNELYRRVLNRNIRLQRLIEIEAPEVIIKNEKRMLQESVDALIDNGRRGQPVRGSNKRPLKSLSEMLRGKQGRFRQNLLGKRVDYSGRSVIVVDPELLIDQCGLPKLMALELFKAHVYSRLIELELAPNLRAAKRMVDELEPQVWDVLEEVVTGHPVLLNRAPTLHRLGIQAFYPTLIEGKAIKIHPLVCSAFNADFDGDQMAVHIPLSEPAQLEAKTLIRSSRNLLSPSNGKPVMVPSQDMILGLHYITKVRYNARGENTVFASIKDVVSAHQLKAVDLHARIKVRLNKNKIVETTVGRAILFDALPADSNFDWINKILRKKDIAWLVDKVYSTFGTDKTIVFLDNIKKLGFLTATQAGISFSIDNLLIPQKRASLINKTEQDVQKIEELYHDGIITDGERSSKIISAWSQTSSNVAAEMEKTLEAEDKEAYLNSKSEFKPFNPIFMMLDSGARGSKEQVKQLVGMRGLMAKPSGEIMETPVKSNFKQGLSVFEYFTSTHGARKGQADTALKTANSGYLTRRLVDVAQDVIITTKDCHTIGFVELEALQVSGDILYSLPLRAYGRVAAEDIKDPITGELLVAQDTPIGRNEVDILLTSSVSRLKVRSVLTCQSKRGICAACYGLDLSKGDLAEIGSPVGIIAAQSIGEPGTQLTMRTFHIGGIASLSEQSSFVAKTPGIIKFQGVRYITNADGKHVVLVRKSRLFILSEDGRELQRHDLEYGSMLHVEDGQKVKTGDLLVDWDANNKVLLSEFSGRAEFVDFVENITIQERYDESSQKSLKILLEHKGDKYQPAISIVNNNDEEITQYFLPTGSHIIVEEGQKVVPGTILIKVPRETSKTKDIAGGLPRIAELFEARVSKDAAILSDIDGEVVFGGVSRGSRKISVVQGETIFDYFVPRGRQINVNHGEHVTAGDQLTAGVAVPHDILRILGPDVAQHHIVDRIQEIYRLQGVDINDRHIELIVKQMIRKVRIVDPGDTDFLIGDRVDKIHLKFVNEALMAEGKRPASARPVLMGITMASLGTESFLSAASFQETTKILAKAAVFGEVDHLYGLKENVIIGRLIPAGTGLASFRKKYLENKEV
ncbi:MAG: DNA-directed RNA polymerase subunit beta' [candidate division TM6 bacterium GW2011_GWE2_41_16]|nr:MAG: DNA-directed RNA polymerase subunit beta' [candidate division TM6 bacterium GW2011_GWE2_41_16]